MTATRRRYTRKQKLAAVMAAEMTSLTEASETTGIPKSTLDYWMDRPEFVQVRTKTREDLAEEIKVVSHLAWSRIAQSLRDGTMEPRDAIFAADKATSLQLLMSGEPTERTETRDLTFDDHEADILGEVVRSELERRADKRVAQDAVVGTGEAGAEGTAG